MDFAMSHFARLEAAFAEVHRSNMAKLWTAEEVDKEVKMRGEYYNGWTFSVNPNIQPKVIAYRTDGKIMKPPSWETPNLKQFLV